MLDHFNLKEKKIKTLTTMAFLAAMLVSASISSSQASSVICAKCPHPSKISCSYLPDHEVWSCFVNDSDWKIVNDLLDIPESHNPLPVRFFTVNTDPKNATNPYTDVCMYKINNSQDVSKADRYIALQNIQVSTAKKSDCSVIIPGETRACSDKDSPGLDCVLN